MNAIRFHRCEYYWPLLAIAVGLCYAIPVRYLPVSASIGTPELYIVAFLYGLSGLAAVGLWLTPSVYQRVDILLAKLIETTRLSPTCLRQFLGFAFANSIYVYGAFAAFLTRNSCYYWIAAVIATVIVSTTLLRLLIRSTRIRDDVREE